MAVDDFPVWVGVLELEHGESVVGVSGALQPRHHDARILVFIHGAPLGYVSIPAQPAESLASRALNAAHLTLADTLALHAKCGAQTEDQENRAAWNTAMSCPRNFPTNGLSGITVVVCTRNRPEQLSKCLAALRKVDYNPIEILIVDNAPTGTETKDIVEALAQDDPRFRYTCEPRAGLSRARNHGLTQARFDQIAFTDDDVSVAEGWPAALAAGFASDPGAVCITGLVVPSSLDTSAERYFDSRYAWGEAFEAQRYNLDEHRHPGRLYPFTAGTFGTGANFAVQRDAVSKIGGFDPLLGAGSTTRGGEDLDIFLRLVLAGERICYLPSAIVWHRHRSDTQALAQQIHSYGYGTGAYLVKHLLNRNLSTSFLCRGLLEKTADTGSRMRQASQASQFGGYGTWLGLSEVAGVLTGSWLYYRASRRVRQGETLASSLDAPQITVITPAYNVDQYIGEAVDSVLTQSFADFEYLVVNDGSTDGTADQVRQRAERDHRVQLINTQHLGACNARNVGIGLAKGKSVAFLDGDDRWDPDFLKHQLMLLESAGPKVAAVFARSRVMSEHGRVYYRRWQRSGRYDFDDMLIDSCPPRTGSSLLIKKQAFDEVGLFDTSLESAQDLDMWLRIQAESGMPYFRGSHRYLLDIRVRPGAISRDHKKRFVALDTLIARHSVNLRKHPEGMAYVRAAVFAFRAGDEDFAQRWARLATKGTFVRLLGDSYGRRLLGWYLLSERQRRIVRQANALLRSLAGWLIGLSGGILR
jgi:glycosyltransferase involved in cell wall biosynthesis